MHTGGIVPLPKVEAKVLPNTGIYSAVLASPKTKEGTLAGRVSGVWTEHETRCILLKLQGIFLSD